jgi:(1->4)-alpha-D-glucan 1-alpha-D-glucosylmutase
MSQIATFENRNYGPKNYPQSHEHHKSVALRSPTLYERATREFIEAVMKLEKTNTFLRSFAEFHAPVARAGMYKLLPQTLLKIAAPSVPDFYQGAELWDFNLVDPDNRRPVDFAKRRASLASLTTELAQVFAHLPVALLERVEE